jgi:hypothetical protein
MSFGVHFGVRTYLTICVMRKVVRPGKITAACSGLMLRAARWRLEHAAPVRRFQHRARSLGI